MEKGVMIPVDLFNRVFDYLGTRPYNEVANVIAEVKESVQVVEVPEKKEESEDE